MKQSKKTFLMCAALLGAGLSLTGCSDDSYEGGTASPGDIVNFGISAARSSRTVYDTQNPYQINWVSGDGIRIYSAQAMSPNYDATYTVTPQTATASSGSLTPTDEAKALCWGSEETHTFYSAYPTARIVDCDYTTATDYAAFTMNYPTNQFCTLGALTDNSYSSTPDMRNAYMVARKQIARTSTDNVLLTFEPIMTTLDISVTAGESTESGTGIVAAPTTLTGISVILPKALKDGQLIYDTYDTETSSSATVTGKLHDGTVESDTREAVFVNIVNGDNHYVDLESGQTVNLMAFLPPVTITNEDADYAKIKLHAAGGQNYVLSLKDAGELSEQNKISINMGSFDPDANKNNNWLTQLDDRVCVAQLTIPGAHDAASLGLSQNANVSVGDQLARGIRAFDFRISDSDLTVANGTVTSEKTLDEALVTISDYLADNTGEFAVVVCRSGSAELDEAVTAGLTELATAYSLIDFSPSLTLGDARGKIIVMRINSEGALLNAAGEDITSLVTLHTGASTADGVTTALDAAAEDYYAATGWALTYCAADNTAEDAAAQAAATTNAAVYNYVTTSLTGRAGIVMTDYVGYRYASTSATPLVYGDVLPQALIDCNYKFALKRADAAE